MTTYSNVLGDFLQLTQNRNGDIMGTGLAPMATVQMALEAAMTNNRGMVVNQDFMPIVGSYLRKESLFWQLMNKTYAKAPIVREALDDARANVGFSDINTLVNTVSNEPGDLDLNLGDPGQAVKAVTGYLKFGHFAKSMALQQGSPILDQEVNGTRKMLLDTARLIDKTCFKGKVENNPLQFNGFMRQMYEGNIRQASRVDEDNPDKTHLALNQIIFETLGNENIDHRISHIFCSASGSNILAREAQEEHIHYNSNRVILGHTVGEIHTQMGNLPVITSPYIVDELNTPNPKLNFWLVSMETVDWAGVVPYGAKGKSLEPQIFDVRNLNDVGEPLLDQRILVLYGTPYLKDGGRGVYLLQVEVEPQFIIHPNQTYTAA